MPAVAAPKPSAKVHVLRSHAIFDEAALAAVRPFVLTVTLSFNPNAR